MDEPLKRLFYELECIKGTWSVKELKRQIGSLLYERTGLSQNKEKLLAMVHAAPGANTFTDLIRDPYIFEFLGLQQREVYPKKNWSRHCSIIYCNFCLNLVRDSVLKPGKSVSLSTMNIILSTWFFIIACYIATYWSNYYVVHNITGLMLCKQLCVVQISSPLLLDFFTNLM